MATPGGLGQLARRLRVPDPAVVLTDIATEVFVDFEPELDRAVSVCWATVDVERTMDDAAIPLVAADRDVILGAAMASVHLGPSILFVGEPDTEGRMAAFLARFGEGVCAVYVEPLAADDPLADYAAVHGGQRFRRTPLGRRGTPRPHEMPWGPFVIELER